MAKEITKLFKCDCGNIVTIKKPKSDKTSIKTCSKCKTKFTINWSNDTFIARVKI